MTGSSLRRLCLALAVLSVCCGCGSASPTEPTGTVHGTVTLNGESLPAVTISFENPARGLLATAQAREDGSYQLTEKLVTGEYAVWVQPLKQAPASIEGIPSTSESTESGIPEKYRSVKTSDLTVTIVPGDNQFDLVLQK